MGQSKLKPGPVQQVHRRATSDSNTTRRKYRRHPKPDSNCPSRPLTAYVRFSKDKRKDYHDQQLTFTDLAKQIGEDWQQLDFALKQRYLDEASTDWEHYRKTMRDYATTKEHDDYTRYLKAFAKEQRGSASSSGSDDSKSCVPRAGQQRRRSYEEYPPSSSVDHADCKSDGLSDTSPSSPENNDLWSEDMGDLSAMSSIGEMSTTGSLIRQQAMLAQNSSDSRSTKPVESHFDQLLPEIFSLANRPMTLQPIDSSSRFSRSGGSLSAATHQNQDAVLAQVSSAFDPNDLLDLNEDQSALGGAYSAFTLNENDFPHGALMDLEIGIEHHFPLHWH